MANNKIIKLYSKDKNSLKRFIQLLNKIDSKWKNLTFIFKNVTKRKKKITVLKSPHVNKTAQTQFQTITYGTFIKYSALEVKKSYILLKKMRNHLFPGVKIKIEQVILLQKVRKQLKNQFLPTKIYYYKSTKNFLGNQKQEGNLLTYNENTQNKPLLMKKTLQFLKVLDNYGSCISEKN